MYYFGICVIGGNSVVPSDFTKTMKYPITTNPSEVSAAQSQVQAQANDYVELVFFIVT